MKFWLTILFFLISLNIPHANTDLELIEIAGYGRGIIHDVVWHPTQNIIAVASGTGVWLYDTDLNTLGQLSNTVVNYVSWNEDGRFLATGYKHSGDECHIWETPLSEPQLTIIEDCTIATLAWNGTQIAYQKYGSQENIIHIIDATNPTQDTLAFETNITARALYWSPNGNEILVLGNSELTLLDSNTGTIIQTYATGSNPTQDVHFSFRNAIFWDDEQLLIYCSESFSYESFFYSCEWDITSNELIKENELFSSNSLYWSDKNVTFTSATELIYLAPKHAPYSNLLLWYRDNADDPFLPDISSDVDTIAYGFNPEQSRLIIASHDGRLIIYDVLQSQIIREAQPHLYAINDLAWHPTDGRLAVTGYGLYYDMQIWYLEDNQLQDTDIRIPSLVAENVDWDATDGGSEITISGNSRGDAVDIFNFGIIDGETYEALTYSEGQSSNNPTYEELMPREASNDGQREVVIDYHNNEIRVDPDFSYSYQEDRRISNMNWSPDDAWLSVLVSGNDEPVSVLIWDTESWDLVYEYTTEISHYSPNFAWSPDSQHLSFALEINTQIHIVDMETLDENTAIHSDYLTSISWSPNSQFIVVGSRNLAFYDLKTLDLVATIDGYLHRYNWRADGAYLAGGHQNGTVQVWDMRPLFNP